MDLRSKDAIETSKQHDIEMGNILIAEFMGVYSKENGYDYTKIGNIGVFYHTSWDWLMPVVDKIESLRDENGNAYRFTIDMGNAQIEGTNIEIVGGSCKLDTTYQAVVEFIKGKEVMDIHAQYSFYIERCVDEVEGEIALSFEEWKQLNN